MRSRHSCGVLKNIKLEELSKKFKISRERVRQNEEKALEKLQKEVIKNN